MALGLWGLKIRPRWRMRMGKFKHGQCSREKMTRAYRAWLDMMQRCRNKKNARFKDYGGRGIKVCSRWLSFEKFFADMGNAPLGKSLDRIDNRRGYTRNNCRWATSGEQAKNRRTNHVATFKGKTQCLSEWATELNINFYRLRYRFHRGYRAEKLFSRQSYRGQNQFSENR